MLDFRAILKSKVPNLANLDQPSFERIYQTFAEKVGKHGLGDLESFYKTASDTGNQQLQAMQERVAQQAAAAQPNQPPPSVSAATTSPEAQRTGLGSGTTVNVFSPEAARAQGAQPPPFSPEATRTELGAGTAAVASDPSLRGGAGPVASPEAQRTGLGAGTTTAPPPFSPEAARAPAIPAGMDLYTNPEAGRTDLGAGTTGPPSIRRNVTDTADQNMLAMAEQAGAGTTGPVGQGGPTSAETMAWLQTDDAQRLIAAQGQGGQEWPNQPPPSVGTPPAGGGVPPAGGGGGGVPPAGGGGGGVPPAGGGAPATAGFNAPTDLTNQINTAYDTLAATTQEQFGGLQTQDFSDQIRALVESGRVSLNELNAQQLATLQQSEQRRMGQIGDIQGQLQGDLAQQEQYRQDIQQQVAADAATRAGQMTADQAARIEAARGALGGQVTSEFEEVAALTGGLTGSQAQSTTAGMDRLAQVGNQAAASRLAAPAMLAAEAQMAVGDEKFRLENQLAQSLSEGMAELNIQEQQQVMQEAMRQEQFGIDRDQALAQALTNIAGQRTGATLGEAGRIEDISQRQGEITQGQAYASGEAIAQRDWQSGEAGKARDWQGEQAATAAAARLNEFTTNFDQGVQNFNTRMEFDKDQAKESEYQFDVMQAFKDGQFEEGIRQFNEINEDTVPDLSPLGVLNDKYPDIDMGLKAIAIGMGGMTREEQIGYIDRLKSGEAISGRGAMSRENAAVVEAMLGIVGDVLGAESAAKRAERQAIGATSTQAPDWTDEERARAEDYYPPYIPPSSSTATSSPSGRGRS